MLRTKVKLISIGGVARGVVLPKIYWSSLDLQLGSIFRVEFDNDGSVLLIPLKDNQDGAGAGSTGTPTQYAPPSRSQEDTSDESDD
jgi:antitoxin component of MazEF toxin-antitoxin module